MRVYLEKEKTTGLKKIPLVHGYSIPCRIPIYLLGISRDENNRLKDAVGIIDPTIFSPLPSREYFVNGHVCFYANDGVNFVHFTSAENEPGKYPVNMLPHNAIVYAREGKEENTNYYRATIKIEE